MIQCILFALGSILLGAVLGALLVPVLILGTIIYWLGLLCGRFLDTMKPGHQHLYKRRSSGLWHCDHPGWTLVHVTQHWTGSTSSDLPDPGAPLTIYEQCIVCGEGRTRLAIQPQP
jgi:hypothetical protein